MHTSQNAHLEPGDIVRAETVRGQLSDFEVVRIGHFDIIAPPEISPAELRSIGDAFLCAANLREERLMEGKVPLIDHGRELPAHDSGRDERPVEEQE